MLHALTNSCPTRRSADLPGCSIWISVTLRGVGARASARFTAVVVFPTPPFWLAMAMMRFMNDSLDPECWHVSPRSDGARRCRREWRAHGWPVLARVLARQRFRQPDTGLSSPATAPRVAAGCRRIAPVAQEYPRRAR